MDARAELEERAGRREWAGLAVLALPTLLVAVDFGVLFLALPRLAADLDASSTQQLWITDVYGFLIAGFLVTMGTLGDRIGRRKLLLVGAAIFGVLSVAAAYSSSAEMLIALRALLGVAGATLMPSTLALISTMFRNPAQRVTAISVWASCLLAGIGLGPVVGGVLLEHFWWGSAFLLGVPVLLLLLIWGPLLLPEYKDPDAGRLDLVSVVLSLAAILPIVYGVKEVAAAGLSVTHVLPIVVGLLVAVVFVRRQKRLADPLVDVSLFRRTEFTTSLLVLLVSAGTIGGMGFLFSQWLQLVKGFEPLPAGLWLLPDAMATTVGSLLAPVLARKIPARYVIAGGLAIAVEGLVIIARLDATSGLPLAVTGVVLLGFGVAPALVLGTDLIIGAAPPERAGGASSISETGSELGVAFGVAAMGSATTAVYSVRLDDATLPAGLSDGAADATRDTVVGALMAAAQLPADVGAAVSAIGRGAFNDGINVAAAGAIPLVILFGVLAVYLLPDAPDEEEGEAGDVVEPVALQHDEEPLPKAS